MTFDDYVYARLAQLAVAELNAARAPLTEATLVDAIAGLCVRECRGYDDAAARTAAAAALERLHAAERACLERIRDLGRRRARSG